MIKLAITGCQGRMGQRITHFAAADNDFTITTLLERPDCPDTHSSVTAMKIATDRSALNGCDVLIDFTAPEATLANIEACVRYGVKMVIGTTGMTPEQAQKVTEASKKIAIVFSSNMSIGVNVFFKLTELAAAKTTGTYTTSITEAHHIHKKDAPSGTAKTLAEIIKKASGTAVKNIESIREGEIVGDHTIVFESEQDTITLFHHAKSRDIFVKGSLVAAKFLHDKSSGLYRTQDVLGLD